ncbi:FUSC family protein [Nocardiopsis quinghaiensis]|uniref:FUSC family protein n=1 Tax=Nocardiopsis quinghaiensis TaxID=464995 RepID=UPI00123BE2B6|nr:aromatic acid exporter family protein [Nocardiopsis quinghaiensis]
MSDRLREAVVGSRWFRGLRRAVAYRGYERETAVIILKSVIASTVAWVVGSLAGGSSQIGFAPFSALLVVTPSVYGSVLQSGRYVAAVFLGALIAGAGGITVGANIWLFALVVLVALLVGQFSLFGEQGKQIAVVAAFALAGGTAGSLVNLGTLLLMVLVGTGTAVVTNTVFAPAIRFRDARNAVLDFADALGGFVRQMADGFREGDDGLDEADYWKRLADGFDATARNAQETVSQQEYRMRLNPRKLVDGSPPAGKPMAYRDWITALRRSSRHLQSLTRTLFFARSSHSRSPEPSDSFLRAFAPVLDAAAEAFRAVHDADEPERETFSPDLDSCLEEAFQRITRMREHIGDYGTADLWSVHSAMLTDMERLFDELYEGHTNTERDAREGA